MALELSKEEILLKIGRKTNDAGRQQRNAPLALLFWFPPTVN